MLRLPVSPCQGCIFVVILSTSLTGSSGLGHSSPVHGDAPTDSDPNVNHNPNTHQVEDHSEDITTVDGVPTLAAATPALEELREVSKASELRKFTQLIISTGTNLSNLYILGPFFTTHETFEVDSADDSDGMESDNEDDMPPPAVVSRAENQGEGA